MSNIRYAQITEKAQIEKVILRASWRRLKVKLTAAKRKHKYTHVTAS